MKEKEIDTLKLGLHQSYVDKNKYIKQNLAVEMESLAEIVDKNVPDENKETFHGFLRKYTNLFTSNIYATKDNTYKNLKDLMNNKDIVLLSGDKETATVIMKKADYVNKINQMLSDGIQNGVYIESEDTTLKDLSHFQNFIRNNFKDHPQYKKMMPDQHQPARLYGTAKTHKFDSYDEITTDNIKLRPIMDQQGTMVYNASQVIADYLRPLSENKYIIKDSLSFPTFLSENRLNEDEEDVSYDVESLFTNVPVDDTIEYIIDNIYESKRLKPICSKTIMKRLLKKLTSECLFTFNNVIYKQIDGCAMGNPLSVVFANIYMAKLERDIVDPSNPILYRRYIDDIFTRKKKEERDTLLPKLNNYHKNIRFTVENNLSKFLDTKLEIENGQYKTKVNRNRKHPMHWSSCVPKKFKRNIINNDLHRASKISSDFNDEVNAIRGKFLKADYPKRFIESVITAFNKNNQNKTNEEQDKKKDEQKKITISIRVPFCSKNEAISKHFLTKLHTFTANQYKFSIIWNTRKMRSLFKLKDQSKYHACVIYQGTVSTDDTIKYIGETKLIAELRWKQHNDPRNESSPAKFLKENPTREFNWKVLCRSSRNPNKRKIQEALFITKFKPKLNNQVEHKKLNLFRCGIT